MSRSTILVITQHYYSILSLLSLSLSPLHYHGSITTTQVHQEEWCEYVKSRLSCMEKATRQSDINRHSIQTMGTPIDRMTVQIQVIQGQDLVAKDRNLFGKRTSSDPYVLVSFASSPPSSTSGQVRREQKTKLGQTVTVKKNLSPTWNFSVNASIPYNKKSHSNSLVFQIFDEDKLSADDSMGVVSLPLEFKDSAGPAAWYNIPKNSGKNASGKIQIQIQTSLHRVQGLTPYC